MNASINLDEVKKYNASLKQYKDQSAQLNAQKEFISKEIDTMCAELTKELGIPVTRDNAEQVCSDLCTKINNSLASGNVVLSKIASEMNKPVTQAQAVVAETASQVVQSAPVAPGSAVSEPVAVAPNVNSIEQVAVTQTAPVVNQPVVAQPTVAEQPTVVQPAVQATNTAVPQVGELPAFFKMG